MQQVLNDFLARRRDRAIAIMLGVKEREADAHLPRDVSAKLRKAILDQMNEFYDSCLDVMKSLDRGDFVVNEEYFERLEDMLEDIHAHVRTKDGV